MKTTVKIKYSNCTMREALDHFYSVYKKVGNDENSSFSLTIKQVIPTKKEENFINNKETRKRLRSFKEEISENVLNDYPLDTEQEKTRESLSREQRQTGLELLSKSIAKNANIEDLNSVISD